MPQDLLGVEIFSTGTFKPSSGGTMVVTGEHLDEMVASFGALVPIGGFTPVLKLGHADAQRFMGQKDGAPNLGIVSKIRRVRDKIVADFTNVPNAVMDLIRQRRFRNVSVEVVPEIEHEGVTFKNVLVAVALLGADLPAVKDLAELATTLFTKAEIIPVKAENIETYTWEQDNMYSQEQLDALVAAAVDKATKETLASGAADIERLTGERDFAVGDAKTARDEYAAYQGKVANAQAESMIDAAIEAGKLLPKQKEAAMAFAIKLTGTVKFGADSAEKEMSVLFAEFIGGLAPAVDLGEKGAAGPEGDAGSGDDPQADVDTAVRKAMAADKALDYSAAMKVVFAADPDLKIAYLNAA